MTSKLVVEAIGAIKAGEKIRARKLLTETIKINSQDVDAWYVLAAVVDTKDQQIECLERVLKINPQHEKALRQLKKIKSSSAPSFEEENKPRKWRLIISIIAIILILSCVIIVALGNSVTNNKVSFTQTPDFLSEAKRKVANNIETNKLDIGPDDLLAINNPKGEGLFVYVEKTEYFGVKRNHIWLVIEDAAYPLNSPSNMVTPSLPWSRDAPEGLWINTNLDPYVATEAIEIVFGE